MPVNRPPQITSPDSAVATEGIYFVYQAAAQDPDEGALVFIFDQLPLWLAAQRDSVFGTPQDGDVDTSFRFIVSDDELSDTLTVKITVIPVNDSPIVLQANGITVIEGDTVTVTNDELLVEDVDNSSSELQFTFDLQPTELSGVFLRAGVPLGDEATFSQAEIDSGWISFAQDGSETVLDSIGFFITDDGGATAHIPYFHITVMPVNDPPAPFSLLVPTDGDTAEVENEKILFVWESSTDAEGDTVRYDFHLYGPGYDAGLIGMTDTALLVIGVAGLALDSLYTWSVIAYDSKDTTSNLTDFQFRMPDALAIDPMTLVPDAFALHQNYPNPFNPSTTIRFDLPKAADVRIAVYDLLGREVVRLVDKQMEAGYHRIMWDGKTNQGRPVSTGLYIVLLQSPEFIRSIKVVMLK